uniref:Granulins domain-containing protein n=2 Tax=Paramormyrops kingsleyae TaxID=1676925 RepID=A0A3B3R687_9TELE
MALSPALSGLPQSSIIICDMHFFCPTGNTCCQGPTGQWGCCPYSLGQCCKDGRHCCEYGFRCDWTSLKCTKGYLQFPSAHREAQPV